MRDGGRRRVLRALLSLYPASFRAGLGEDLVDTVLYRWRDARDRWPRTGTLRFWLTEGMRFVVDGVLERLRSLPQLFGDLGLACRHVRRAPAHHAVAVATLALGIAATTTIFTVTDAVVFRPLPYPDPGSLYDVDARFGTFELSSNSLPNLRDLHASVRSVTLAGAQPGSPSLTDARGMPERVATLAVTDGYLAILGARVRTGRSFVTADHAGGAERVAIVSNALWARRWGSAADVIGRTIRLDSLVYTIVGVMAPGFRDPEPIEPGAETGVWLPAQMSASDPRGQFVAGVIGRLNGGGSLEAAQAELTAAGAALAAAYPRENRIRGEDLDLVLRPLHELTIGDARARLLLLLGAVVMLLVLSCANAANLFLARSVSRAPELTVRTALGATRLRLAAQLFGESLVTAGIAGVIGGAAGVVGLQVFVAVAPAGTPRLHEITLDLQALGFVVLLTVLTAVAFGTVPALRASHEAATAASGFRATTSRRTQRLQSGLVALEVALALVLVTGSALLLNSLRHLLRVPPGFDGDDVIIVDVLPPFSATNRQLRTEFYEALAERARAEPGVEHVGLVYAAPGVPEGSWSPVSIIRTDGSAVAVVTGGEAAGNLFRNNHVLGEFFEAVDIKLLAGRLFNGDPGPRDPGEVVLNRSAARLFFPDDQVPVGRRLKLAAADTDVPLREVVGIVADVRQQGAAAPVEPQIYVPFTQRNIDRLSLLLELRPGATLPAERIHQFVGEVAPGVPVDAIEPLSARYAANGHQSRFLTFLVSVFAAIGLLLAVVGTYATASHALSRRIRELGIRIALGAGTASVFRLVLSRALAIAAVGIGAGLVLTLGLTRFLESYIFGITVRDPITFGVAAAVIATCAAIASLGPAVRAARVDPNEVLRSE